MPCTVAAASTVGIALGSVAYAFVEAAFSPSGLHFAVLWDLGNMLSGQNITQTIQFTYIFV